MASVGPPLDFLISSNSSPIHRQFIANSYFRGQQTKNGTVNGMPNVDWISDIERDNF